MGVEVRINFWGSQPTGKTDSIFMFACKILSAIQADFYVIYGTILEIQIFFFLLKHLFISLNNTKNLFHSFFAFQDTIPPPTD